MKRQLLKRPSGYYIEMDKKLVFITSLEHPNKQTICHGVDDGMYYTREQGWVYMYGNGLLTNGN